MLQPDLHTKRACMAVLKTKYRYDIIYVDPNYPCKCICHTPGLVVKHVMACCQDQTFSYFGAEYVGWGDKDTEIFLLDGKEIVISKRTYRTVQFIEVGKCDG